MDGAADASGTGAPTRKRPRFRDEVSDIGTGGDRESIKGHATAPVVKLRRIQQGAGSSIPILSESEDDDDEEQDDAEMFGESAAEESSDEDEDDHGPQPASGAGVTTEAGPPTVRLSNPGDIIQQPSSILVCCDDHDLRRDMLREVAAACLEKGLTNDLIVHTESRDPTFFSNCCDSVVTRMDFDRLLQCTVRSQDSTDCNRLCLVLDDVASFLDKKTTALLRQLMINVRKFNVVLVIGCSLGSAFPKQLHAHIDYLAYTYGRSPMVTKAAYEICPFFGPWKDIAEFFGPMGKREFYWMDLNSRERPGEYPHSAWRCFQPPRMLPKPLTYRKALQSGIWNAKPSKCTNVENDKLAVLPGTGDSEVKKFGRLLTEGKVLRLLFVQDGKLKLS